MGKSRFLLKQNKKLWTFFFFLKVACAKENYSGVPNSGTGTNNSTGWEKYENLIIVQDGINVIGGIYPKIK